MELGFLLHCQSVLAIHEPFGGVLFYPRCVLFNLGLACILTLEPFALDSVRLPVLAEQTTNINFGKLQSPILIRHPPSAIITRPKL